MEIIKSASNKKIKYLSSLKMKKNRIREKKFIVEGEKIVRDSIAHSAPELIIADENTLPPDCDAPVLSVSSEVFKKLSDTVSPQGIMAVFKTVDKDISTIEKANTLILNKINDPGNMGTLIRTAVASGFTNIIIDKGSCDVYSPKVIRSTMSAVFSADIYISDNLSKDIDFLKKSGLLIVATALSFDSTNLYETDIKAPAAVIIGNEANGIEKEILEKSDKKVIIPIEENIESLNAAVAGAVTMFEIKRRESL